MPLTPEQIADGWIEHDGGECPIPYWQVLLRDGRTMRTRGSDMYWPHFAGEPYAADIIAYRPENRHD